MAENNNMIFQYIRHPKTNGRRGIAVAVLCEDGIVRYGMTLHRRSDKADADLAKRIATERALKGRPGPKLARNSATIVEKTMANLQQRAERYFKDAKEFQSAPTFTLVEVG